MVAVWRQWLVGLLLNDSDMTIRSQTSSTLDTVPAALWSMQLASIPWRMSGSRPSYLSSPFKFPDKSMPVGQVAADAVWSLGSRIERSSALLARSTRSHAFRHSWTALYSTLHCSNRLPATVSLIYNSEDHNSPYLRTSPTKEQHTSIRFLSSCKSLLCSRLCRTTNI